MSKIKKHTIQQLFNKKIVVLEGAMGTSLQERKLTPEDFGGEAYDGCNENLVRTRPDVIQAVHEDKVLNLEARVEKLQDKMDKMMDSDEEIMEQHEELFKKLQQGNTGYSYN